jgi:hypothetical protein
MSETVIGVVIRTFDDEGGFTQFDNIKGSITGLVVDRPGSGTYQVNPDCSGTTQFVPGPGLLIEERMVGVDYGHEIRSITAVPAPVMVSAVAKRTALAEVERGASRRRGAGAAVLAFALPPLRPPGVRRRRVGRR